MASKEQSSGLLSKVARFVRNPTVDWADLEKAAPVQEPEPESDSGFGKQTLKEMIERKRKNDFVRRREFAQLRKIRSRGPADYSLELNDRNSLFEEGPVTGFDDRTETLKKIDDIEAQMSRQWWQSQHAPLVPAASAPSVTAQAEPDPVPAAPAVSTTPALEGAGQGFAQAQSDVPYTDFVSTLNLRTAQILKSESGSEGRQTDFASTEMTSAVANLGISLPGLLPDMLPPSSAMGPTPVAPANNLPSAQTEPDLADLEEAAIRFANGDDAGAEATLMDVLQGAHIEPGSATLLVAALFDFYSATGQQTAFERAQEWVLERFGLSAPAWVSIPARLGRGSGAREGRDGVNERDTAQNKRSSDPIWTCPYELTVEARGRLDQALASSPMPWILDWRELKTFEPAVVDSMSRQWTEWCNTPVQLTFLGADALDAALRHITPSGDASAGLSVWRLRLSSLRIMGRRDEFELAALDFCVTFELPPPVWQPPQCVYQQEGIEGLRPLPAAAGGSADVPGSSSWQVQDFHAPTVPMGLEDPADRITVTVAGDALGDASGAMAGLYQITSNYREINIACDNLIRIDFFAAGRLLNWLTQRQAQGCQVRLLGVNHLVAAFFHVIGIQEHAVVERRLA